MRPRSLRSPATFAAALALLAAMCLLARVPVAEGTPRPQASGPDPAFRVVVLPTAVRDSMNAIWQRVNQHWNELHEENTLTQMLGTGKPTQLEYLGCLRGSVDGDTLRISGWTPARGMKQFQFAVTGDCTFLRDVVGTWHTHPYRADSLGHVLKEPGLSLQDLQTFAGGHDQVVLVVWDVDSLDSADRGPRGTVRHPATLIAH